MYSELAYEIAKAAHKGQTDKGGNDYILHPAMVANMMDTDAEKAVAYLHDVLEDTSMTLQDLSAYGFSEEILSAIEALTRKANESYDDYIYRVSLNAVAKKVKLADLIHNSDITRIKDPSQKDIQRIRRYKQKIKELSK